MGLVCRGPQRGQERPPGSHKQQAGALEERRSWAGVALTGHPRSLAFGFGPRTQIAPAVCSAASWAASRKWMAAAAGCLIRRCAETLTPALPVQVQPTRCNHVHRENVPLNP